MTEISALPDGDYLRQLLERVVVEAQMHRADPSQFHPVPAQPPGQNVAQLVARSWSTDVVRAYAEECPRGVSFCPAGSEDDRVRAEALAVAGEEAIHYRLKVASAIVGMHARYCSASDASSPRYEIESAIGSLLLLASSLGESPLEVALCAMNDYGDAVWRDTDEG